MSKMTAWGADYYTREARRDNPMATDLGQLQEQTAKVVPESPFSTQVGGDHYSKLKIQPFQYSLANGLGPAEHTVVKYVTRWRDKGGIRDLEKAKHVIDLLIAFEKEQQTVDKG